MSECSLLTPLRRDGTSKRQRMPAALDPSAAPVDGRSTADLLLYSADIAKLLRYYTESNHPKGDWREFLAHDVSTLAAAVGAYDVDAEQKKLETLRDQALAATPATFSGAFDDLVNGVLDLAVKLEGWRTGALEGLRLRSRLERIITGLLASELQDTLRAARRAASVTTASVVALHDVPHGDAWGNLNVPEDLTLFASGGVADENERRVAVGRVATSYERFVEALRRLVQDSPRMLADTLAAYPQHRPHVALFLAFLRLLNYLRRDMNGLTGRHLDFYYRDVLRLVPRGPVADRVHVIFELAKKVAPTLVAKDAGLNAAKDSAGKPLVYGMDTELVVNHATLDPADGLKTVFVETDPATDITRNIYAAADADADDISQLVNGEKHWPTLGGTNAPFAHLGFAIASPMLWLGEGTRKITITFTLASGDYLRGRAAPMVTSELTENVIVEATGPKGWMATSVVVKQVGTTSLVFEITIDHSQPPVVALVPAKHLLLGTVPPKPHEGFDPRLPVIRFTLKNDGLPGEILAMADHTVFDYSDDVEQYAQNTLVRFEGVVYQATRAITQAAVRPPLNPDAWSPIEYAYPYKYFEKMQVQDVTIAVDVQGMHNLIVDNDFGKLNVAKPFAPFGTVPKVNGSFLVGSREIFSKPLTDISLHLKWAAVPTVSFAGTSGYYHGYTTTVSNNSYFNAAVEILRDGEWWPRQNPATANLFGIGTGVPLDHLDVPHIDPDHFPAQPDLQPFKRYEPGLDRGFMRLRLNRTFLHEEHAAAMAGYAKTVALYIKNGTGDAGTLPNPPFTPMASELTVGYTASQTLDYPNKTQTLMKARVDRLIHIGPFGYEEFAPITAASAIEGVEPSRSLVPVFPVSNDDASTGNAEGTLYLGLADLVPGQNLSMLFQMAEGSEDPALAKQDVQWGYRTATGWKDFARDEILLDSTNGLIGSGIVRVAIPNAATDAATVLPSKLHWLRATVRRHTGAIPKTVGAMTQAAQASFRDHGNALDHLAAPLAAGTIAKLIDRQAEIKSVLQPFSSFDARMPESDAEFRIRISERLRHKHRAVTVFDYERLVLEQFPDVYKARCLTHTRMEDTYKGVDYSEYAPGCVVVVVVPNLRNRNAIDPLRPRFPLARLDEIRRYLAPLATDFADIRVVNPEYEEVRVVTDVRFARGFDKNFYTGQLERDIIRFLSPWLYDEGVDLAFGGGVHRSAVLNYVERRDYVDFVANFTIDQILPETTPETTLADVEMAMPTRSCAVIVSSGSHHIGDAIVSCYDDAASAAPAAGSGTAAPSPTSGTPRYLGNSHTRELHDLWHTTPDCHLDLIPIDRMYPVRRVEQAIALGYDYCAYCFPAGMSQR